MLTKGDLVIEGKTKQVFRIPGESGLVLIESKDRITAGDGSRAHDLEGKAAISTSTTCKIFEFLANIGVTTHYVEKLSEVTFKARECTMIPIEWVTRRVATGSFLRRHPGVKEGFRFCPPKQETFFKDDANHDPQWSREQLIEAQLVVGGVSIGMDEVDIMERMTLLVFEVLEKMWASLDCALIDMKIEFGVDVKSGKIVLADVIDSDSWRLWPAGDKRLMKDKQVYRNLETVTDEALQQVKRNFRWVADQLERFSTKPQGQVVILMGSPSDQAHCEKIAYHLKKLAVPVSLRITSAHKGTRETLSILAQYEGMAEPTVLVAVAGRSNGLGPVLAANTILPVINCPPLRSEDVARDVWSSLSLPSGLGCSTVIYPDAAAISAAQILALHDPALWCRLRANAFLLWLKLKMADSDLRNK